jgi:hypothetical protein
MVVTVALAARQVLTLLVQLQLVVPVELVVLPPTQPAEPVELVELQLPHLLLVRPRA